jgi:hypothetical protein
MKYCFPIGPDFPVFDIAINDGDIRRLWSYNSARGGNYVSLTNNPGPEGKVINLTRNTCLRQPLAYIFQILI